MDSSKVIASAITDLDSSKTFNCHGGLLEVVNYRESQDNSSIKEERQNNEDKWKIIGLDMSSRVTKNAQAVLRSLSCTQNSLNRYHRQKGPRVAKVVRRTTCNVEPLEFRVVQSRHSWCDKRAIYPKGFWIQVKYINISDPTDMCYYISEIQDAGQDRPLFMVLLEKSENEEFVHLSTARWWEMLRERVNQEMSKRHKLERLKLPPVQLPGSLDGMGMLVFPHFPLYSIYSQWIGIKWAKNIENQGPSTLNLMRIMGVHQSKFKIHIISL